MVYTFNGAYQSGGLVSRARLLCRLLPACAAAWLRRCLPAPLTDPPISDALLGSPPSNLITSAGLDARLQPAPSSSATD